ncbi:site-specific integrase [Sphingobium scionense]|uniref:Integrase n=1 Tax=Sphingobium scionense TaxID=1404341 RepID=A0A7W6LXI8_9SPHN|nr:site-specific integrase [Sphingobium scionense]MBB4152012.1 integrase [Sphingobium scionense]
MSTASQIAASPAQPGRVSVESAYADDQWQLTRGVPGVRDRAFRIDWSFTMPDGSRFSDERWHRLLGAAKQLIWSLHADPPPGRKAVALHTLTVYANYLRVIVLWMATNRFESWAQLDRPAIKDLFAHFGQRGLSYSTARNYHWIIKAFYEQRGKLAEAPPEPPPMLTRLGNWRDGERKPHTPDVIAVPLIAAALHLIGHPADAIIAMREDAQAVYDTAARDGLTRHGQIYRASAYLRSCLPVEMRLGRPEMLAGRPIDGLNDRILRLYDACFIVIAYLVGARASEIFALETDCIKWHDGEDGQQYAYLQGAIRKGAPGPEGLPHRWIVPDPVVRAIAVLERLSAPWRTIHGGRQLWLVQEKPGTALRSSDLRIHTMSIPAVIKRLNSGFALLVDLPTHRGERWHLTTHQGRRTFAQFVGRRDRTGLAALSKHFGHVTRAMTDRGYVGTDFELVELADDQAIADTRAALEDLLVAPRLAGKAGRMLAERSPFRGRTQGGDIDAYITQLLAETDMRLGVCDWGYCLYRRETSACLGSDREPNPVLRTQSTCVTCANFVVTEKHRPIWAGRLSRNLALLDRSDLDPESRALATTRAGECQRLLAMLDSTEGADEQS